MKIKAIDAAVARRITTQDLRKRLQNQEEKMSEAAFKLLEREFANYRFFSYPLFDPPDASNESRELLADPGIKYNFLLLLLRNCRTNEERLFVIATWLHQERICQPEDLLGSMVFFKYRRRALRGTRGRLSFTDIRQALIVDLWKPYFERLLLARSKGLDLKQAGFEEHEIQSATDKRSAVAAACEYVSPRLGLDIHGAECAHSRIFSKLKVAGQIS